MCVCAHECVCFAVCVYVCVCVCVRTAHTCETALFSALHQNTCIKTDKLSPQAVCKNKQTNKQFTQQSLGLVYRLAIPSTLPPHRGTFPLSLPPSLCGAECTAAITPHGSCPPLLCPQLSSWMVQQLLQEAVQRGTKAARPTMGTGIEGLSEGRKKS